MTHYALVIGINAYPNSTGQLPLAGAVADACDFAEWALAANGGEVDPHNLYFWTHPWPAAQPPGLFATFLANPTPFLGNFGPVMPNTGIPPTARQIVDTVVARGTALQDGMDLSPPPHRIYIFLAGHGLHTNETSQLESQTCFLAADFSIPNPNTTQGLVASLSLKRALINGGFDEVFMFLDCCRLQDPINSPPAAPLCGGHDIRRIGKWAIGNAADENMRAFEVEGQTPRGAFTLALMDGLRNRRHPASQSLSLGSLRNFVGKRIQKWTLNQTPTFEFKPRAEPGPYIFPGIPGAALQSIQLDLSGLPAGVTVCLSDTDLIPLPGFEAIPSGAALVSIPDCPPGSYMIERSDQLDEDPQLFMHPRKKPYHVS